MESSNNVRERGREGASQRPRYKEEERVDTNRDRDEKEREIESEKVKMGRGGTCFTLRGPDKGSAVLGSGRVSRLWDHFAGWLLACRQHH